MRGPQIGRTHDATLRLATAAEIAWEEEQREREVSFFG